MCDCLRLRLRLRLLRPSDSERSERSSGQLPTEGTSDLGAGGQALLAVAMMVGRCAEPTVPGSTV
eukprot:3763454-Alexandrium_andersonii.AAC.1